MNKRGCSSVSRAWLIAASLFFYGWSSSMYLPLLLISILLNYYLAGKIASERCKGSQGRGRGQVFWIAVIFNILLLISARYPSLLVPILAQIIGTKFPFQELRSPLGISFITFIQVAYLADVYTGRTKRTGFLDYLFFISYFPYLLAGPIVLYREIVPQVEKPGNALCNYENISKGLFLFGIGLFKKVVIADSLAVLANNGFAHPGALGLIDSWLTSLSYTFQIYYDFSGYTDMALGSALIFNIKLPINFNSPYFSVNIQEFWRKWHITLGRFLREYIYIPLGGNRLGSSRTYVNLLTTFLICGLWHGLGWTFILWGLLHGAALVIQRAWARLNLRMNSFFAWFLTFNFVNISWVFFRADSVSDAIQIIRAMSGLNGLLLPSVLKGPLLIFGNLKIEYGDLFSILLGEQSNSNPLLNLIIFSIFLLIVGNSGSISDRFKPNLKYLIITILLLFSGLTHLFSSNNSSEFIYFNF